MKKKKRRVWFFFMISDNRNFINLPYFCVNVRKSIGHCADFVTMTHRSPLNLSLSRINVWHSHKVNDNWNIMYDKANHCVISSVNTLGKYPNARNKKHNTIMSIIVTNFSAIYYKLNLHSQYSRLVCANKITVIIL